ncbi:MAG: alpha-mannosidase [Spirochaetaceae bacterium]|nr:MAG: alpha-mannosidase [Spirochaetaceae bacterium]
MTTVHMIGNAHLDPVWLWRKRTGIGETLLTCWSMVERLDEFPDFIFTRSDVWVYEVIRELDPALFRRIREFVAEGRWAVVGGWYVQPDCNLPSERSFERHFELGSEHHLRYFGERPTVGHNVDSFGHSGGLPSLLMRHGYDSYVFMRPGPHEKKLPGSLFRWRSPDGSEVLAWRIHDRYNVDTVDGLEQHIPSLLEHCTTDGVDHVMCFYGVGDHGGGPTRTLLEWIAENRHTMPGCELVFSSPRRFFDAVLPHAARLPVVADELQYHAVGCYSVAHETKVHVRRAENLAVVAERAVARFPDASPDDAADTIESAWRHILFNQFHDVFDGTSEPDAYIESRDEIGAAAAGLTSVIDTTMFRRLLTLPPDPLQRVIAYNPASVEFSGCVAHEPWLDWSRFEGLLVDEKDRPVAYQVVQQPSRTGVKRRLLWDARIPAGALATWRLRHDDAPSVVPRTDLATEESAISNDFWRVSLGSEGTLAELTDCARPEDPIALSVALIDDPSDTWSHFVAGYARETRECFRVVQTTLEETGPIRATFRLDAEAGSSTLSIWFRLFRESPSLEIDLALTWAEKLTVSKFTLVFPDHITDRDDTVPGAVMKREQDGKEYPLLDTTVINRAGGSRYLVCSPDAFGIDGFEGAVRFTLLRSSVFAWQGKNDSIDRSEYQRWTDRGEHFFRFRIEPAADGTNAAAVAESMHQPPLLYDWTVGMHAERGPRAGRTDGAWQHDEG